MPLIRHQYLRQLPILLAIAAVVAVLVVAVPRTLPFTAMVENWVADFRVASRTPEEPQHPDIMVLEITEDTLATLPYRSPVDRGFLAAILEKLAGAGVRAVGLDILLDSDTEPEKEERLRRIIASYPVPLIAAWSTMDFGLTESQAEYLGEFLPPESRGLAILFPYPYDDTIRWLNPGQEEAGKWLPSLTWALADALGADPDREVKPLAWRGKPAGGDAPFASFPAHTAV
jgi:adenylate cyclase